MYIRHRLSDPYSKLGNKNKTAAVTARENIWCSNDSNWILRQPSALWCGALCLELNVTKSRYAMRTCSRCTVLAQKPAWKTITRTKKSFHDWMNNLLPSATLWAESWERMNGWAVGRFDPTLWWDCYDLSDSWLAHRHTSPAGRGKRKSELSVGEFDLLRVSAVPAPCVFLHVHQSIIWICVRYFMERFKVLHRWVTGQK